MTSESILSRSMQTDEDYWQVHKLILDTVPISPLGYNWDIRRWEGKRFYDANPAGDPDWWRNGRLWHTKSGKLIGAVNSEGSRGFAYLQVHPDYRHIEGEMIDWAKTAIFGTSEEGIQQIHFFIYEYDVHRQALLRERNYEKMDYGGVIRYLRFGTRPLAQPNVADGYTIRTTNPEEIDDCQKIADLLNAAFNRDFHTAAEYQEFTRNAPSFRREIDLVAVAPDGTFASYVGVPYDSANKLGIFEPVCTHPDHRQKGLGKALMQEALLRLKAMGAVTVSVETGDQMPANRLYNSIGFTEMYKGFYWRKATAD